MNRLLINILLLMACSCSVTADNEYLIEFVSAKTVELRMQDLFPDFKEENEYRTLIEVTLSSKKNFIEESIRRGTTLVAHTGYCKDFEHIPTLAFNSVFYQGKSAEYYLMDDEMPKLSLNNTFSYQLYINADEFKKVRRNSNLDLCIEFYGATYLMNFKSNKVKLDWSEPNLFSQRVSRPSVRQDC